MWILRQSLQKPIATMKMYICILVVLQVISSGRMQRTDEEYLEDPAISTQSPTEGGITGTEKIHNQINDDDGYDNDLFEQILTDDNQSVFETVGQTTETDLTDINTNDTDLTINASSLSEQKSNQTTTINQLNGTQQVEIASNYTNITQPNITSQNPHNFEETNLARDQEIITTITEQTTDDEILDMSHTTQGTVVSNNPEPTEAPQDVTVPPAILETTNQGTALSNPEQAKIVQDETASFTGLPTTKQTAYATLGESSSPYNEINNNRILKNDLIDRPIGRSAGINRRQSNGRRRPNPNTTNKNKIIKVIQDSDFVDSRCESAHGQFAHPDNCALYYNCWNSIVLLEACPSGLLFDDVNQYCDYPENLSCGERTQTELPVGRTELCPTLWGIFPKDCETFYNCIDGVATEVSCPEGLAFSVSNNTCDYPERVPGCEGMLPYNCGERYGKFSKEDPDCKQFWLCVDGNARILSCSRGKRFDPRTSDCRDEDKVQC